MAYGSRRDGRTVVSVTSSRGECGAKNAYYLVKAFFDILLFLFIEGFFHDTCLTHAPSSPSAGVPAGAPATGKAPAPSLPPAQPVARDQVGLSPVAPPSDGIRVEFEEDSEKPKPASGTEMKRKTGSEDGDGNSKKARSEHPPDTAAGAAAKTSAAAHDADFAALLQQCADILLREALDTKDTSIQARDDATMNERIGKLLAPKISAPREKAETNKRIGEPLAPKIDALTQNDSEEEPPDTAEEPPDTADDLIDTTEELLDDWDDVFGDCLTPMVEAAILVHMQKINKTPETFNIQANKSAVRAILERWGVSDVYRDSADMNKLLDAATAMYLIELVADMEVKLVGGMKVK